MRKVFYEGFRFRPMTGNKVLALQIREGGGRRLPIGQGKVARMRPCDEALSEAARAAMVTMRQALPESKGIRMDVSVAAVEVSTPAVAGMRNIPLPEMIDVPELPFKVAKGVVTGGQIAALVETGYEIVGHNKGELEAAIAETASTGRGTDYVSLLDGRKLVEEMNKQNPGRKFRLPKTEAELMRIFRVLGEQLRDREFWILTEEETSPNNGIYVLCLPDGCLSSYTFSNCRSSRQTVLLVENRDPV